MIDAKTFRSMNVKEVLASLEIATSVIISDKIDELTSDDMLYLAAILDNLNRIIRLYFSTKVKTR
jgi:hypothetical protein